MPRAIIWDAAQYAAHSGVQLGWARELLARLALEGGEHVLDVGCGDGKITAEIARAAPRGQVTGADASPEMVAFARRQFPRRLQPNLRFVAGDARRLPQALPAGAAPFDVVFSNAALHWVDDHEAFLQGAAAVLKPGGRLLVSCGGRGNAQDVFLALRPELRAARWRRFFRGMPTPYFFYAPEDYRAWLPRHGFVPRRVRLAAKRAFYAGASGFAAWLRTTWIPYVQRVPAGEREEFIAAVTRRYLARQAARPDQPVPVRMVRLEIDAIKVHAKVDAQVDAIKV